MKKRFCLFLLGAALCGMAGCMSVETLPPDGTRGTKPPAGPELKGVYHKVKKGETLWRIAQTYNVPIKNIIEANSIPDVARVENDQLVFIPGADRAMSVPLDGKKEQNDFIWPVEGKVMRYFRSRTSTGTNKGIDISVGDNPTVRAARGGRVVFADYLSGYGPTVILDHSDGYFTVYSFNSDPLVKLDDTVPQGREMTRINPAKERAFLHFEIRRNSIEDNPLYYLP